MRKERLPKAAGGEEGEASSRLQGAKKERLSKAARKERLPKAARGEEREAPQGFGR